MLQVDMATGKELRQSSKDPVNFARSARFRKTINRNEQYLRNISDAKGWITTTNSLLDNLYTVVVNAKGIATQGADDSLDANTRSMLADKINGYIEEVVSLANSKYLGKNVFAGTKTREDKAFVFDGSTVTYQGNAGSISRRVGDNVNVSINVTGKQLENSNLFSSLIELRDSLAANDQESINSSIDAVSTVASQLISLSSAMGSIQKQLELTTNRLEVANLNLSSYLSQAEDVDLAEAITKYNSEEMAYRAALQTSTSVIKMNLLDFL